MANWENYSIEEAMKKIDAGEWVLPVIQRDFVWPKEKIVLLFDSVMKTDPFGGIMAYVEEAGSNALFAHRQFSKNGESTTSSLESSKLLNERIVIIDGQQRLQSLYLAIKGDYRGEMLWIDVLNPLDSDEYDFRFSKDELSLPNTKQIENGSKVQCKWISLHVLSTEFKNRRNPEAVCKRLFELHQITNDDHRELIRANISRYLQAIYTEQSIGISKLFLDQDDQPIDRRMRMVELFRRLNDGGTKLSGMDLIASQVKAFDWEMETRFRGINETYNEYGFDADAFIKLSLVISGKPKSDLGNFNEDDAKYLSLNFSRIESSLIGYTKFIQCSGFHSFVKSRKTKIPGYIVASYLYYSKMTDSQLESYFNDFDTTNVDFRPMKKWLLLSLLNGFFSRGCGWIPETTGVSKVYEVIARNKGKPFPLDGLIRCYQSYPRLTYRIPNNDTSISDFDRDIIFRMMYGERYGFRQEDVDHIHPKSLMFDEYPYEINLIENFQLLDSDTNRNAKRAKPFIEWFREGVNDELKEEYLERHFIPKDQSLWNADSFREFLSCRRKLIVSQIMTVLG
jgi:hypothetical protein